MLKNLNFPGAAKAANRRRCPKGGPSSLFRQRPGKVRPLPGPGLPHHRRPLPGCPLLWELFRRLGTLRLVLADGFPAVCPFRGGARLRPRLIFRLHLVEWPLWTPGTRSHLCSLLAVAKKSQVGFFGLKRYCTPSKLGYICPWSTVTLDKIEKWSFPDNTTSIPPIWRRIKAILGLPKRILRTGPSWKDISPLCPFPDGSGIVFSHLRTILYVFKF